jgi:hypothetical protein
MNHLKRTMCHQRLSCCKGWCCTSRPFPTPDRVQRTQPDERRQTATEEQGTTPHDSTSRLQKIIKSGKVVKNKEKQREGSIYNVLPLNPKRAPSTKTCVKRRSFSLKPFLRVSPSAGLKCPGTKPAKRSEPSDETRART